MSVLKFGFGIGKEQATIFDSARRLNLNNTAVPRLMEFDLRFRLPS